MVQGRQGVYRVHNAQQAARYKLQLHTQANPGKAGKSLWAEIHHPRRRYCRVQARRIAQRVQSRPNRNQNPSTEFAGEPGGAADPPACGPAPEDLQRVHERD